MTTSQAENTPLLKSSLRAIRVELAHLRAGDGIRKHSASSIQALADSMDAVGQLSPIGICPIGDDGRHDLLFGYGRVAAADQLGWTDIEAKEFPGEYKAGEALRISVSENTVRRSMNFLELWEVLFQYSQETGQDVQPAGKELGFEQGTISKIVKCIERVSDANKKALAEAGVGFTKVYELSQAEEPLQTELVKRTIEEGLTREQIHAETKPNKLGMRKFNFRSLKGELQISIPRSADAAQLQDVIKEFTTELSRLLKEDYRTDTLALALKDHNRAI